MKGGWIMNRLRELRDKQGWRLDDVAQRMGLSATAICQYEKSKRDLSAEKAKAFAEIYGVTTDYIYGLTDSDAPFDDVRQIQLIFRERPDIRELYMISKDMPPLYVRSAIASLKALKEG